MKPFFIVSILIVPFLFPLTLAQTVKLLNSEPETVKDAFIFDLKPDVNYGEHPDFAAIAWTNMGTPVIVRSLISFDLKEIPEGVTIIDAKLSLFSYNSPANGHHSTRDGPNTSYIQKIVSPWSEYEVTWNNQPFTTSKNQAVLPSSQDIIQDYKYIDITKLVIDLYENPKEDFGLMIKLKYEDLYRRLLFASSDNEIDDLHPQLRIVYLQESDHDFTPLLYPNPSRGLVTVDRLKKRAYEVKIEVFNILGVKLITLYSPDKLVHLDLSGLPKGSYLLRMTDQAVFTKKLILN